MDRFIRALYRNRRAHVYLGSNDRLTGILMGIYTNEHYIQKEGSIYTSEKKDMFVLG